MTKLDSPLRRPGAATMALATAFPSATGMTWRLCVAWALSVG
ncbi:MULTISPECIES: hypothetical protein [unclassified Micromonospora]|nr:MULTISPECIES: hypothetical protein [unclassified Micromonospora]MCZ7421971.1 hypothetical protein [Verrucosispora sp. WMMA2121]WBB93295.1 hypothetical protein O7597_10115 [Verrucosispora sp. WMMC514]